MEQNTLLDAKRFVHQNLAGMLDLRKISVGDIQSENFREKTKCLVENKLRESRYASLAADVTFIQSILDETLGLGPLEALMKDDEISEIMVNGPDEIFVEKQGHVWKTDLRFTTESCLRNMISRVVSPLGRRIDEASPMVDARLPDGSRFNAIIPPLSLCGPVVTIRKFSRRILEVSDLIRAGSMTQGSATFLHTCVQWRKNILIAGGTGSGKTTLLNLLSGFIPAKERIVTIEDAAELKLNQCHVLALEARPENVEGKGEVRIRDLLKNALRMRPDRIIVGECRGDEALDMLQAMNTGHEGSMTTIHANSARDALLRLETLTMMSGFEWPLAAIRQQIESALDIIVFIRRDRSGRRRIAQITEVCGMDQGTILTHDLFSIGLESGLLEFSRHMPRFFQELPKKIRTDLLHHLNRDSR